MVVEDTGPEFEDRARAIARAIYDPSGTQGAVMHQGREHDGLFITSEQVVAIEFTISRTKDKALQDARKAAKLASDVCDQAEHRHRSPVALVVTREEPTADQRDVVKAVSREVGLRVSIMSASELRKRLVDVESYIALRLNAPFGSSSFGAHVDANVTDEPTFIEPRFAGQGVRSESSLGDLLGRTVDGSRSVILGDFGLGKSTALFEGFKRLRKSYFRDPAQNPFPMHINLGDLTGTRSPDEILRRHAGQIGFKYPDQLVAAWRAGACVLLLDGFDELVPSRWVGGAKDLRSVRRQALAVVRQLIEETPRSSGVLLAGRAQYFSDINEVRETLGVRDADFYKFLEFDIVDILESVGASAEEVPEWMPTRPLLIGFLASLGFFGSDSKVDLGLDRASWWARMIKEIAEREARRVSTVTPESMLRLIARVATLCRASTDPSGSIPVDDMRQAFRDVCGYEPDEEGLQVVLRLPGLESLGQGERQGSGETRAFVDADLAEAAFGVDLYHYFSAPHSAHPLGGVQLSSNATTGLAPLVAAELLGQEGFEPGTAASIIRMRVDAGVHDFVLLEAARCADARNAPFKTRDRPIISEVIVPELVIEGSGFVANALFTDSLFEKVRVVKGPDGAANFSFQRCEISTLEGLTRHEFERLSTETVVGEYLAISDTNSLILGLPVSNEVKVALSVLKKVYFQSGSARMESALFRGLPSELRQLVPDVLRELVATNYIEKVSRRGQDFYSPVASRRGEVARSLESPPSTAFWGKR